MGFFGLAHGWEGGGEIMGPGKKVPLKFDTHI